MKNLVMLFLLLSVSACASVGKKINHDQISSIEKGKTTRSEIIQMFGKPTMVTELSNETIFTYIHSVAKNTVGNFIPVYNVFRTEMKSDTDTFTVKFSKKDIVEDYTFSQSTMPVTAGLLP